MFISMALIAVGFSLRLFQYFQNRSLWLDEIYLSSSLVKMNFMELAAQPLDYEQKAPIGYLFLSRLSVICFGRGEMALRFFPLLSSFLALGLFIPVTRFFLRSGPAAVIAIGILALSPPLIYHSVEAKQYSTELLGTVVSLYLYTVFCKKLGYSRLVIWGLSGGLILWFSFSSIFVLAGIASGVSCYNLIRRKWQAFFLCLIPFSIWMLSFIANYLLFTSRHADSEWLLLWFKYRGGFMPGDFAGATGWLTMKLFSLTNFPLGLSWFFLPKKYDDHFLILLISRMAFVPLFFMIVGLVYSFRKALAFFLILILPLSFHLLTTALGIYPFFERLTVYLSPLLILLIAIGAEGFLKWLEPSDDVAGHHYRTNMKLIPNLERLYSRNKLSLLVIILLLTGPLMHSLKDVAFTESFGRIKHWHQRELYNYLSENYKKGDAVYIYWNALVPYRYYSRLYNYKFTAVQGKDNRFRCTSLSAYKKKLEEDIRTLRSGYRRVWVVKGDFLEIKIGEIDNQPLWYYYNREANLEMRAKVFGSLGKQIDLYKTKENISLELYEVNRP